MSGYFDSLIERSFGSPGTIRPQLPSRFEVPAAGTEPLEATTQGSPRTVVPIAAVHEPHVDEPDTPLPPFSRAATPVTTDGRVETHRVDRERLVVSEVHEDHQREIVREITETVPAEPRVLRTERLTTERLTERVEQLGTLVVPAQQPPLEPAQPVSMKPPAEGRQAPSTTVKISIGRVEIVPPASTPRAAQPQQRPPTSPARPVRSLDSFLRDRSRS